MNFGIFQKRNLSYFGLNSRDACLRVATRLLKTVKIFIIC